MFLNYELRLGQGEKGGGGYMNVSMRTILPIFHEFCQRCVILSNLLLVLRESGTKFSNIPFTQFRTFSKI